MQSTLGKNMVGDGLESLKEGEKSAEALSRCGTSADFLAYERGHCKTEDTLIFLSF